MSRRIFISVTIVATIALAIFLGGWVMQPRPRIDQETFDKIKVGMTGREVEELIGAPPGDYGIGIGELEIAFTYWIEDPDWPDYQKRMLDREELKTKTLVRKDWLGANLAIAIWTDVDGNVCEKTTHTVY